MRKILLACMLVFFGTLGYTQQAETTKETIGMFMRGNQVMYAKRGYISQLQSNQTLVNGSTLNTNGLLTNADGSKSAFEQGVLYSFDGEKIGSVSEYVTIKGSACVLMTNEILTSIDGFKFENGETIDKAGKLGSGDYLKEGEKLSLKGERLK